MRSRTIAGLSVEAKSDLTHLPQSTVILSHRVRRTYSVTTSYLTLARTVGSVLAEGAGEGCESARAGAERLLRSRHAVFRDRVRHGASGCATGTGRAHRDEVLRGRPHDVRASAIDRENEARPPRVHRPNRAAMS